jgi:hypothetical protein
MNTLALSQLFQPKGGVARLFEPEFLVVCPLPVTARKLTDINRKNRNLYKGFR